MSRLVRNQDGSITTDKYTLRSVIIARYLTESTKDCTEELHEKINALVDTAFKGKDVDRLTAVTIDAEAAERTVTAIDALIQAEK